MMKKVLIGMMATTLVLSSCGTMNTAEGAYVGAGFGRMVGSTIGGITGGWRGHEIGSLVGMVGGAVVGGVAASASESGQQRQQGVAARRSYGAPQGGYDGGYDPQGRGDDRLMIDGDGSGVSQQTIRASALRSASALEIRDARIVETNHDGVLTRGEECTVILDIVNVTGEPVYNVSPIVEDATGNKHIAVSPPLRIEKIDAHQGIRYTATVKADRRLKNGEIVVRVGVRQGGRELTSQSRRFTVPTAKFAKKQ